MIADEELKSPPVALSEKIMRIIVHLTGVYEELLETTQEQVSTGVPVLIYDSGWTMKPSLDSLIASMESKH